MDNQKRLHRNIQNKVIGGVCSGLGDMLGIDPTIIRILFVVFFLAGGSGFLIYLILWIILPADRGIKAEQFVNDQQGQPVPVKDENRGGLIGGIALILLGCLFLLGNLVPRFNWHTLWPIILIAIGLLLILPLSKKNNYEK